MSDLPARAPLEPHMGLLLRLAQEFDRLSAESDEMTGAVDFVDWIALELAASGPPDRKPHAAKNPETANEHRRAGYLRAAAA